MPLDYGVTSMTIYSFSPSSIETPFNAFLLPSRCYHSTDILFWDCACNTHEFNEHIHIDAHVALATRGEIEMRNIGVCSMMRLALAKPF